MSHSYGDLAVWQKSMALVGDVYRGSRKFPKEELFGLTSQIRRAAISIPSNIAEGQGRLSRREFKQFLSVSRGSLLELETQLLISEDLGYLTRAELGALLGRTDELLRMLNGLMSAISSK